MNTIIIRPIQPEDNAQIAAVIRQVFIDDDFPKTGTAFADAQLDLMFETYNKPKAIYFVVETEGKIIGGAGISQLENYKELCRKKYMVDKSLIIEKLNDLIGISDKYICITRPRRFQEHAPCCQL